MQSIAMMKAGELFSRFSSIAQWLKSRLRERFRSSRYRIRRQVEASAVCYDINADKWPIPEHPECQHRHPSSMKVCMTILPGARV